MKKHDQLFEPLGEFEHHLQLTMNNTLTTIILITYYYQIATRIIDS